MLPHNPLLIDIPLAIFHGSAFVVRLLAFGEGDLRFDQVAFPVELGADTGVTFLFGGGEQSCQLLLMEQQFAGGGRVRTQSACWLYPAG